MSQENTLLGLKNRQKEYEENIINLKHKHQAYEEDCMYVSANLNEIDYTLSELYTGYAGESSIVFFQTKEEDMYFLKEHHQKEQLEVEEEYIEQRKEYEKNIDYLEEEVNELRTERE